jgi:hypothetical protein
MKLFNFMFVRTKLIYLRICGSFKSAKNNLARKSANSKEYLWSVNPKSANKHIFRNSAYQQKINPANLRICDLLNLFADRPPLVP